MSAMDDQPLSLDHLLEKIKAEAAWQEGDDVQVVTKPKSLPFSLVEDEQQKNEQWEAEYQASLLPDSSAMKYHVAEFLYLDDEIFLGCAYACLFKRPLDEGGKTGYLNLLAAGWPKPLVLASLMASDEGQAQGVELVGNGLFRRAGKVLFKPNRLARKLLGRSLGLLNKLAERYQLASEVYLLKKQQQGSYEVRSEFFQIKQQLNQMIQTNEALAEQLYWQQEQTARLNRALHYQALAGEQTADVESNAPGLETTDTGKAALQQNFEQFYLAFEDACRGSEQEIEHKLTTYLDYLPEVAQAKGPVLDMGCGRGEWLQLLEQQGYQAQGLDNNPYMLETCQRKGLKVESTPLHQWLSGQSDGALAAVTGFHIAEHLPFEYLLALLQDAARALAPGGVLILETPNPENVLVGSHTFYHDPTHRNPLTPTLMEFVAQYIGLEQVEIRRLTPYPASARVDVEGPLAERVNGHLCGPQDFALIARKPDVTL